MPWQSRYCGVFHNLPLFRFQTKSIFKHFTSTKKCIPYFIIIHLIALPFFSCSFQFFFVPSPISFVWHFALLFLKRFCSVSSFVPNTYHHTHHPYSHINIYICCGSFSFFFVLVFSLINFIYIHFLFIFFIFPDFRFFNFLLYRSMFNVWCCCSLKHLGSQNLMVQVGGFVAKRGASVLKRRKSRNRMERNSQMTSRGEQQQQQDAGPTPNTPLTAESQISKSESDGDVVFYMEEPRSGEWSIRFLFFH